MEHLSFNCVPNWLFELSTSYFLTRVVAGLFAERGFFMILILVVLIVITAVVEFVLMLLGWILGIVLTIVAFVLQAAYIWIIPLCLLPGTVFLYVRSFRDNGVFNKILNAVLIVFITFCVIRYGIYTFQAMFPDR